MFLQLAENSSIRVDDQKCAAYKQHPSTTKRDEAADEESLP
jgi:hypothetical protein